MFKIIDSPTKADELQAAGLLWWKQRRSETEYKPDNVEMYGPLPSETWPHHDFAILIEE